MEVKDHVVPTVKQAKPPEEVLAGLADSLDLLPPELDYRFTATPDLIDEFEVVKSKVTVGKRLVQLVPVVSGSFVGNYWPMPDEAYAGEPVELPAAFRAFRHTVLQAELHLRDGTELRATFEARSVFEDGDFWAIEGTVQSVRQSLVAPVSNFVSVETTIVLETADESATVVGPGAFVVDYEAREVVPERV